MHVLAMATCKAVEMKGVSQGSDHISFKELVALEAMLAKSFKVILSTVKRPFFVVKCIFAQLGSAS